MKPVIKQENVETLFDSRYIKIYDLQYAEGAHYFNASRREKENLAAIKTDEEFRSDFPDAVTIIVILRSDNAPDRLLLSMEYRYPAGRYLLSPPAGLLDPEDRAFGKDAEIVAAKREVFEETGLEITEEDSIRVFNPLLLSSPGMTDESNGIVLAVCHRNDLSFLSHAGAVGTENFGEFKLLTREDAKKALKDGRDENGNYYSVYTALALLTFVSGLYEAL